VVASKPDRVGESHPTILRKDESMLNDSRTLEEELGCYFKMSYYLSFMCVPVPPSPLLGMEQ
jgi:hypothetical protein